MDKPDWDEPRDEIRWPGEEQEEDDVRFRLAMTPEERWQWFRQAQRMIAWREEAQRTNGTS